MMKLQAVLFDLDGVLVSTDECHFQAWDRLAEEEGIPFSRKKNERLRGVSRWESLAIVLEEAEKSYTEGEKEALAARKNEYYRELICRLTERDVLPGVRDTLSLCARLGLKTAVASSSKNARLILEKTGLSSVIEKVVDGNAVARGKPDPEVFLKAAEIVHVRPECCLVVEDAEAGVEAGIRGGMQVLGIGSAQSCSAARYRAASLGDPFVAGLLERLSRGEEQR